VDAVKRPYKERAVLFGRERTLVGVTCRPVKRYGERPAIIFLNSGIIHRIGANRIHVMLARALAERGFSSLRFDLSGLGDSVIPPDSPTMSPQKRSAADIDDALDFAANHMDAERVIMVGICSGADNALRTMGRCDTVVGSILLDLNGHRTPGFYVHALLHYSRKLLHWESWQRLLAGDSTLLRALTRRARGGAFEEALSGSPAADPLLPKTALPLDMMRDHLERIAARNGRILAIFTAGQPMQYNYERQLLDMFPRLDLGQSLRLEYFADSDHTFSRQHLQARLRDVFLEWAQTSDFPHPQQPTSTAALAAKE